MQRCTHDLLLLFADKFYAVFGNTYVNGELVLPITFRAPCLFCPLTCDVRLEADKGFGVLLRVIEPDGLEWTWKPGDRGGWEPTSRLWPERDV